MRLANYRRAIDERSTGLVGDTAGSWTIQAGFVRKWIFSFQTHSRGTKWTRQFRNTNFIRRRKRSESGLARQHFYLS